MFISLEIVYGLRHLARALEAGEVLDPYDQGNNLVAEVSDRAGCARLFDLMASYVESLRKLNALTADEMYDAVRGAFEAKLREAA